MHKLNAEQWNKTNDRFTCRAVVTAPVCSLSIYLSPSFCSSPHFCTFAQNTVIDLVIYAFACFLGVGLCIHCGQWIMCVYVADWWALYGKCSQNMYWNALRSKGAVLLKCCESNSTGQYPCFDVQCVDINKPRKITCNNKNTNNNKYPNSAHPNVSLTHWLVHIVFVCVMYLAFFIYNLSVSVHPWAPRD